MAPGGPKPRTGLRDTWRDRKRVILTDFDPFLDPFWGQKWVPKWVPKWVIFEPQGTKMTHFGPYLGPFLEALFRPKWGLGRVLAKTGQKGVQNGTPKWVIFEPQGLDMGPQSSIKGPFSLSHSGGGPGSGPRPPGAQIWPLEAQLEDSIGIWPKTGQNGPQRPSRGPLGPRGPGGHFDNESIVSHYGSVIKLTVAKCGDRDLIMNLGPEGPGPHRETHSVHSGGPIKRDFVIKSIV